MRDKRIRFYRWVSFRIFKQEEACYPNKLSSILYAILFPLDWLYARQSRIKYSYEIDMLTIDDVRIQRYIFSKMSRMDKGFIVLQKDEMGRWVESRESIATARI